MAKQEEKKLLLNEDNAKSIKKLIREAAEKQIQAEKLLETAGDKYTNILVIMKESGVRWGLITATIQNEVFTDWPRKESGLPRGYQELMKEGYKPALYLNRFIAWRDKYYKAPLKGSNEWGKLKSEIPTPELTDEEKQAKVVADQERKTRNFISEPHVVDKDLVRHAFKEIFTFAAVRGNTKAQELLLAAFKSLGLFEGETLSKVETLVKMPEGEMVLAQVEEKQAANASSVH